ncbi:CGNR zinc finger domain-containing protein [Streptosporangium sp. NPDC051023]|uniref:CGNR zinc finger domain-containing protein n=1 Tax=Streptosporangium sp. NPDC051023 TaxID=3155410 RepID=UPI00344EF24B
MKRQDAPGELELVREFVNTRDLEQGTDALATPEGLRAWLVARTPIDEATPVDEELWRRAVLVREALRALARANSGTPVSPEAVRVLDELARDAAVRLRVRDAGDLELAAGDGGGLRELGGILAVVGAAALDGTWQRFKVCPAEDCLWAFYDHSRNRAGLWCQMAECGNRTKVRTYRARHTP